MAVVERTVDLGAVTLAVDEAGVGGRPLLLLHGYTGGKNDFVDVIGPLAERGWHVVAPDHRGHGSSSKPASEDDYSFELFAADALALADTLGWDSFVLLGHSMGGMIAQILTLTAPERVRGLILMDTSHRRVEIDPEIVALGAKLAREEGLEVIIGLLAEMEDPLSTPAHERLCAERPGYRERGDDNTRACSPAMYASMLLQITGDGDRLGDLASIACPTLVIVGDQDVPFIEPSRRMADAIPGARLELLAGAGHSPQFESPDEWWRAVGPFLDALAD